MRICTTSTSPRDPRFYVRSALGVDAERWNDLFSRHPGVEDESSQRTIRHPD